MNPYSNLVQSTTDKIRIEISEFHPDGKVPEWHVMLHPRQHTDSFPEQLSDILACIPVLKQKLGRSVILRFARCFMSDASNQQQLVKEGWNQNPELKDTPLSLIQQPPLDGSKMVCWLYLSDPASTAYTHLFSASRIAEDSKEQGGDNDSEKQTLSVFKQYEEDLQREDCSVERNCVRTWLFVRDVDVNYVGVVKGRSDFFRTQGMTAETHFIASTGIQGQTADANNKLSMDAYAIRGLQQGQVAYLYAKTHLNPTYEYHVTFERGVSIQYGDRRHLWISGTASIDNKGQILFPGDVARQTQRMWENVEALLKEGGSSLEDVQHLIVYLRDTADYEIVHALFGKRFPHIPTVFLLAPVCRPGWLIEMECMAIARIGSDSYSDF